MNDTEINSSATNIIEHESTNVCAIANCNDKSNNHALSIEPPNEHTPDIAINKEINAKNHLSFREAQDIVSKLYNACKRNPKLHVIVGGFLLQLLNTVENKNHKKHVKNVNDKVLLKMQANLKYDTDAYTGPFKIVQVNNNGTVKIRKGCVTDTYNLRNIKPFHN